MSIEHLYSADLSAATETTTTTTTTTTLLHPFNDREQKTKRESNNNWPENNLIT